MLTLFNYLWGLEFIRLGVTYFIILYILSLLILLFTPRVGFRIKRMNLLIFTSLAFILLWLSYVDYRIGLLPYGSDSATYPSYVSYMKIYGKWEERLAPDPYYRVFHSVIFEYSILAMISGTIYIYPVLQASIVTISILGTYILISRFLAKIYKSFIFLAELPLIVALLYIATPPLGYLDIIPQVYSMTLAIVALFSLTVYYSMPGYRQGVYLFTFIAIAAIISHLSSAILIYAFLLALHSKALYRSVRRDLLVSAVTIFIVTLAYLIYATLRFTSFINVLEALYEIIVSGFKPIGAPIVSRAYQGLEGVKTWILSWMLLPALSASILTYVLSSFLLKKLKKKLKLGYPRIPLVLLMIMILELIIGGFARLMGIETVTGVDMLRYPIIPAYYGMYIAVPLLVVLLLKEKYEKSWRFQANTYLFSLHSIILVILILLVTITSGLNDPARSPWNGEPKMGPVTFNDRIEMQDILHYVTEEIFYIRVHDAYVDPLQYKLKSLTRDYYSNEEVMRCIINHHICSKALQILQGINSPLLVITYRSLVNNSYNVIASLNEHAILYITKY